MAGTSGAGLKSGREGDLGPWGFFSLVCPEEKRLQAAMSTNRFRNRPSIEFTPSKVNKSGIVTQAKPGSEGEAAGRMRPNRRAGKIPSSALDPRAEEFFTPVAALLLREMNDTEPARRCVFRHGYG